MDARDGFATVHFTGTATRPLLLALLGLRFATVHFTGTATLAEGTGWSSFGFATVHFTGTATQDGNLKADLSALPQFTSQVQQHCFFVTFLRQ